MNHIVCYMKPAPLQKSTREHPGALLSIILTVAHITTGILLSMHVSHSSSSDALFTREQVYCSPN